MSALIRSATGELLSELPMKPERWRQYFEELLNRPPATPSPVVAAEATTAMPSPLVECEQPTLLEVRRAFSSLKMERAAGCCGISPEMLKFGEPYTSEELVKVLQRVGNRPASDSNLVFSLAWK